MLQVIFANILLCNRLFKNDNVNWMPEKSGIKEGCNQNDGLSVSYNLKQFHRFFAVTNHLDVVGIGI